MVVSLDRRRFTADNFERMAEAGIFGQDERVELLAGEIVSMRPIGPSHAWCVNALSHEFAPLRPSVVIAVQNPVRLEDGAQPQPDIALIRRGTPRGRHPRPADVVLIVEVASSSIAVDRDVKAPLYARAGLEDYWIFDLDAGVLLVHREPSADGYGLIRVVRRGQRVSPLFAPDLEIDVGAILGTVTAE